MNPEFFTNVIEKTARMDELYLSFKFPAAPRQNSVEWFDLQEEQAEKKADRYVTSQLRICKKAKGYPIRKVGSHSSFLAFGLF